MGRASTGLLGAPETFFLSFLHYRGGGGRGWGGGNEWCLICLCTHGQLVSRVLRDAVLPLSVLLA